jgi:hypothetical protein
MYKPIDSFFGIKFMGKRNESAADINFIIRGLKVILNH